MPSFIQVKKVFISLTLFLTLFPHALGSLGSKVVWEKMEWKVLKGEHFNVHYPKGYDDLGKTTLIFAEEANIMLSRRMGHRLTQVIPIFVYPSHSHFQMTNIIHSPLSEGIGGFTERIKKRVVLPFMGSYDGFRHVLTHEIVHAFQYDILLGGGFSGLLAATYSSNPPLWLVEGMAEYFSIGWDATADMAMRDAVLTSTLPSIYQLSIGQVMSGYMIYKGGQSIMRFISQTWGEQKIVELLKDVRDLRNIEDTFKANFDLTSKQFNRRWQRSLKRKYFHNIEKNIDEEEAYLVSKHFEDRSFFNMHPTISKDGKKIAYLSIRDFFPAIVVKNLTKLPNNNKSINLLELKMEENVVIHGTLDHDFYQLHLLDNRISFTPNGNEIFFTARSSGKDHLYLVDVNTEKVIKKFTPALDMIQFPRLSPNGYYAVFTGTILGQPDLYILDMRRGKIRQVTFDLFSEKQAVFSNDSSTLYFSSNKNDRKNYESRDYDLFQMNIKSSKAKKILELKGNQIDPSIFMNQKKESLIFSSNHKGIFNLYKLDPKDSKTMRKITNVPGGIFNAQFSEKKKLMVFTMYRKQGYDIALKKITADTFDYLKDDGDYQLSHPKFPIYPAGLSDVTVDDYGLRVSPDFFFFGAQYSQLFGFGGFVTFSLSDYLGNHFLNGYVDYLSAREDLNFQVSYGFLKNRTRYFISALRATNYFSVFSATLGTLSSINDFLYNPNAIIATVKKYGIQTAVSYPVTPYFLLNFQVEVSRLEEDYIDDLPKIFSRKDIFTNINGIRGGILFNNVLYSMAGPIRGWHFNYSLEQTFNISGTDFVYQRHLLDARKYFLFFERYVFATRILTGGVWGPQFSYFPWQIGGYNTIRAFEFLSLKGTKIFASNFELRFPLVDAVAFGLPVRWVIRGVSGVLFFDIGATYEDGETFKGYNNGRLKDFKASFGLGLRFLLFPGMLLKIDWGTPTDLVTALPMRLWQGTFSMGYEY